jgi:hypothetical protein
LVFSHSDVIGTLPERNRESSHHNGFGSCLSKFHHVVFRNVCNNVPDLTLAIFTMEPHVAIVKLGNFRVRFLCVLEMVARQMRREEPELDRQEFCERFVERMVRQAASVTWRSGRTVREYAEKVAPTYWVDAHPDGVSPELCADEDISYWDEEE